MMTRGPSSPIAAGGTTFEAMEKATAEIGRENIRAVLNRAEGGHADLEPYYGSQGTGPMTESVPAPPAPNKVEQVTP